jgi:hypothetical protein
VIPNDFELKWAKMVATNALSKLLVAAKDIKTMLKHISLALIHSFKTRLIILKTNLRKNLSVGID